PGPPGRRPRSARACSPCWPRPELSYLGWSAGAECLYRRDFIEWNDGACGQRNMVMDAADQPRGHRPAHGEPVLDRAFRILTAFGPDRSLSLSALSVRAALPKPTALRLARKLADLGALQRTRGGEYVIGLRLLEIASLAPRGHGLRATALPYMEDLHLATGQHVLLAVRDGGEAILVERLSARGAGRVMYRVGGRLPLHATGVGMVLLAHAPVPLQEAVLSTDLTLRPENVPRSSRELRGQLAAIRHDGIAVMSRSWPEPVTTVAAPILGPQGLPVAALSVVTSAGQVEPAVLRPAVVAVDRAISRAVHESRSAWADTRL